MNNTIRFIAVITASTGLCFSIISSSFAEDAPQQNTQDTNSKPESSQFIPSTPPMPSQPSQQPDPSKITITLKLSELQTLLESQAAQSKEDIYKEQAKATSQKETAASIIQSIQKQIAEQSQPKQDKSKDDKPK